MKLLVDQNLSPRVAYSLRKEFPDSRHVRDFDMQCAADTDIWEFAKQREFIVASKDSDFHHRSFVFGQPPKIAWVRLGNCTTDAVIECLLRNVSNLELFESDGEAAFLSIS